LRGVGFGETYPTRLVEGIEDELADLMKTLVMRLLESFYKMSWWKLG
jgi:hypothetical protein